MSEEESMLYWLVNIMLASLALLALIKFVAPISAAGTSAVLRMDSLPTDFDSGKKLAVLA